jgi:hypothetical protein
VSEQCSGSARAGLLAWIVEKFRTWSDCNGNVESRFTKDELLTNVSIYWFNQNITSSARLYYEVMGPFSKDRPSFSSRVKVGPSSSASSRHKNVVKGIRRQYCVICWRDNQ